MNGDDEKRRPWWEAIEDEDATTAARKRGAPGRTNETSRLGPRHPSVIVRDVVTGAASNVINLRALIDCLRFAIEERKRGLAGEFAVDVRGALAYQRAQLDHAHRLAREEVPDQVTRVCQELDQLADLDADAAPWLALAPDAHEDHDRDAWLARVDRAERIAAATRRDDDHERRGGHLIDAAARFRALTKGRPS